MSDSGIALQERLVAATEAILPAIHEDDGALTVQHDGTFCSLRVVTISAGLDLVSLNQMLVWDLPLDATLRAAVADHTRDTLLGTVALVEKGPAAGGDAKKTADVLLRYNFPAVGLSDEALGTLIMMVLATGADVRRAITP